MTPSESQNANGTFFSADYDELCRQQECRPPFTVSLLLPDGSTWIREFDRAQPIVPNGQMVSIFSAERVFLAAEIGERQVELDEQRRLG
jgi:hypothetical protein